MKTKALIIGLCITVASFAQFDTTLGTGTFVLLDSATQKPLSNLLLTYKAIAIQDTIFGTSYTSTTNAQGEIPFNLPTYFKITIGLDENGLQTNTLFYPNPGSDLNVVLPNADNYELTLLDFTGKTVAQQSCHGCTHLYANLAHVPYATYIAHVRIGQNAPLAFCKFVKTDAPALGQQNIPQTQGNKKTSGNGATYQFTYNAPLGYFEDTLTATLQDGFNGTVPLYLHQRPNDTSFVWAYFNVSYNGKPINNARLTSTPQQLNHITPQTVFIDSLSNGLTDSAHFIVSIDTNGMPQANPLALYNVWVKKEGFVNAPYSVNLQSGANNIVMNPWDTAYANGGFLVRDSNNNSPNNLPLTMTTLQMDQVMVPHSANFNTGVAGGFPYANHPVSVDTTGATASTTAQVEVSWPQLINTTSVDSLNPNLQYMGITAGDTTLNLTPGNNGNKTITVNLLQVPQWHGKQRIKISAGQFDKGFNRTAADNALVVFYNQTQNTTDTITLDVNGEGKGPWANDGDKVFVGSGYVGGVGTNGEHLKMIKGVEIDIAGATFANPDTITELKYNFLPDSVNVSALGVTEGITSAELKQMHQKPTIAMQNDTIYRYINPTNFSSGNLTNIQNVIDSANTIFPIYIATSTTPLPNPTYTGTNYNGTNHGINISNGSNNITNIQQKVSNIKGETTEYVTADVQISAATSGTWKEIFYQYFAFAGVPSNQRISITNGSATTIHPTTWDFANFILKYHFEHEMFKGTTPASSGTPTQNISVNFYYDDNNITPQ